MGIPVKDLISSKEIGLDDFRGKVLVIDAYNMLYQFLTTVRQRDGSPLTDSNGNITSHLTGLFSRMSNLMERGIRPAFVFDGTPPELKSREKERRKSIKLEALKKYEAAKDAEDLEGMKRYASQATRMTPEVIEGSKRLISAFGCPVIDAPSEGEAQAAYVVRKGHGYATVSQDFDTLLYGTPRLVRNLSVAGKRKRTGKLGYVTVRPEEIVLSENLNRLGIDIDQLTALAMLVGTDYNIGGIKGIGPKKALELVKKHGKDFEELFKEVKWDESFDLPWTEVYYLFKNMPMTDDYKLEWKEVDTKEIKKFLCEERDFSPERVDKGLEKLGPKEQKGLGDFL